MTEILPADPSGISRAATLLQQGALVALPTETVYGLGADARNGTAVAGIYEAWLFSDREWNSFEDVLIASSRTPFASNPASWRGEQ